jgi:tetratricopeptide (TPR) repeat protein
VAAVAVVFALGVGSVQAQAASDTREIKAREDFAAGRFQEALDIFARLYAESLHPIYLRNIGRCYQGLQNPDRAIATFRDYLRKSKAITLEEKKEIEGFISEMEDLKRQREAAAAQPAAPAIGATPVPAAADPAAGKQTSSSQAVLVGTPATPAAAETSSVYTKWWFWTLVGAAVVAGGVGIAASTGAFDKTQNATCPTASGFSCPR